MIFSNRGFKTKGALLSGNLSGDFVRMPRADNMELLFVVAEN